MLLVVVLMVNSSFAQFPMMGAPKGKSQAVPNLGHVYGKVVDKEDKPISEASVVLLHNVYDTITKKRKEVLLKGFVTKANGEFSFEELPIMGPLKLKITALGYKPVEQTVAFQLKMDMAGNKPPASGQAPDMTAISKIASAFEKDLGNIRLETDVKQMQGVTVTASSGRLKMDIDKKVFNVDKNLVTSGGTGLDVMKNVPSVQVDIDGNVKLRNSTPQIYVEGRPTTLTLDQIPADAIESVEVITNPSAKYDASGGNAGIINIILKKNRKTGYNGMVLAGVDKRGGMNGGGNFNVRQGKLNITANAFTNIMRNITTGNLTQTNIINNQHDITHQTETNKMNGGFLFGNLGVDFFATNRTTFSLAGTRVHGQFKPNSVIDASTDSIFNNGNDIQTNYERRTTGDRTFNATGFQGAFKHLFPKDGEELTADGNYFSGKNTGGSYFTTDYYKSNSLRGTELEKILSTGNNKFLTIQTDYKDPLNSSTKIEAGLRAQIRNFANTNNTYLQDTTSAEYKIIPNAASNYKDKDYVYAAYTTFTSAVKNFGYQVGLRAESSNYQGELLNTGDKFNHNYAISLFPSVFLSQKLSGKQEIQLSYTRRINRPNFFNLIPYTDRTNKLNVTRGNPDLVPEFTNSLEASYSKTFKGNNNLLISAYYKHTDNLITPYLTNEIDPVTGGFVITYINANSSYSAGAEFTSVNYLNKWWDVTTNINVYNSAINTSNVTAASQAALWSWFGKMNNNFKLPKNFTIQLSANYQSKTNLPVNQNQNMFGPPQTAQSASQGFIRSFYAIDAAIKKSFLKNNAASLTLSFNDIFRTRIQNQHAESTYFIQDYSRLTNPQMIRLTFSYRFGKMDMSLFKRKNMNNNGMQGATEGMGQ